MDLAARSVEINQTVRMFSIGCYSRYDEPVDVWYKSNYENKQQVLTPTDYHLM